MQAMQPNPNNALPFYPTQMHRKFSASCKSIPDGIEPMEPGSSWSGSEEHLKRVKQHTASVRLNKKSHIEQTPFLI